MIATALALAAMVAPQWSDVRELGTGGESFVSVDNKGTVYVSSHLPAQLLISRDYGQTFDAPHKFRNALGDLCSIAWGDGKFALTYMYGQAEGLKTWYSKDSANTLTEGQAYPGPYDREWLAVNPQTDELYLTYSDGYIGGPKSKGVYLAASGNLGDTFQRRSQIDIEPMGSYAVDPYLANNPNGRLYAAWAASKDYDTIDAYRFAWSDDAGKTWQGHQTIAEAHKLLGDTQERWMLGGLLAVGEDTVIVYYQDYAEIVVDGRKFRPLLTYFRKSVDGGKTFTPAATVMPIAEIALSIQDFRSRKLGTDAYSLYIQSLPWLCADPNGNVYAVLQDNRSGQAKVGEHVVGRWNVRTLTMADGESSFGTSEKVSREYRAKRPPLDFMCCAADGQNLYVTFTEALNPTGEWEFSGRLMLARKKIGR